MTNSKPLHFITAVAVLIFSASVSHAGSVTSLSRPAMLTDTAGVSYQKIDVKCSHVAEARSIVMEQGASRWCSKDVRTLCGKTKLSAAKKVCSIKFDSLLAENDSIGTTEDSETGVAGTSASTSDELPLAGAASNDAAPAPLSLEQRRLELDRQRLELRRKELELKKQQLELERAQTE